MSYTVLYHITPIQSDFLPRKPRWTWRTGAIDCRKMHTGSNAQMINKLEAQNEKGAKQMMIKGNGQLFLKNERTGGKKRCILKK